MDYWKIDEERRIVAVSDIIIRGNFVKQDQIGGVIPESIQLPGFDIPLWVENGVIFDNTDHTTDYFVTKLGSCYIGANCKIGYGVEIDDGVIIEPDCEIGKYTTIERFATISNNVIIREQCEIGHYTKLGEYTRLFGFVRVGRHAIIHNRVTIHKGVNIGDNVRIGHRTDIYDSSIIGKSSVIGNDVAIWKRVVIGEDFSIGECSLIETNVELYGRGNIANRSHIAVGKYFQFVGCGDKARTLTMYRKHGGETVISVGCQCGISLGDFKTRVHNAHGTSRESADIYRKMMPMFDRAYAMVSGKPLFLVKLQNLFK